MNKLNSTTTATTPPLSTPSTNAPPPCTACGRAYIPEDVERLTKDLKDAARTLSAREARFLVDAYYTMQEYRKAAVDQAKRMDKAPEVPKEPHTLLDWVGSRHDLLENQIKRALDLWTDAQLIGRWAKSQVGIGPVITAGLLAEIDITKCDTVSPIWRFAGLAPDVVWEKGEKRPWNARLKSLTAFKLGECFVKVCNKQEGFYGHVYARRKRLEWERNLRGDLADQAVQALSRKKFGKDTQAKKWYEGQFDPEDVRWHMEQGLDMLKLPAAAEGRGVRMLPPAHIHARARRYAVKMFLAHLHWVMYRVAYRKDPPKPYAHTYLRHDTEIAQPPNFSMILKAESTMEKGTVAAEDAQSVDSNMGAERATRFDSTNS